ncbi:MAG: phosphatidylglycerophosphatase A [Lysobacterales bacterium]
MSRSIRHEARVLLRHPLGWIACGLGSGLSPLASGTTGSLAAVLLYWATGASEWPWYAHLGLLLVGFGLGVWASAWACRALATDDAAPIVIDEWVGQWMTLAAGLWSWRPHTTEAWLWYLGCGFALFRLADISKPWPASRIDRDLGGGLGAMADDGVAGVYAALAMAGLGWLTGQG